MIGYPIQADEIRNRIASCFPGWLEQAKQKTDHFRQIRKYQEKSSSWSKIKPVFMAIQHNKCAYCERRLEGQPYGRIEHDIEHFRPKNAIRKWPTRKITRNRDIQLDYPTGEAWSEGYYLLAYNIENYATACKTCNSILKSNYFPVAGKRGPQSGSPRRLLSEKPFLPYPLGNFDVAPESIIGFEGLVPVPRSKKTFERRRAEVAINLFELDTREELLQGRAEQIRAFILAMSALVSEDPRAREFAQQTITSLQSPESPHSNCTRSFITLYNQNRPRAERYSKLILEYLQR